MALGLNIAVWEYKLITMKTRAILVGIIWSIGNQLMGQALNTGGYSLAIGVRAGETSGIDLKYNNKSSASIEVILGLWNDAASFTCMYEKNAEFSNTAGLRWYYGVGGHTAFATETYFVDTRRYIAGNDVGLGVDGIFGLEYKIPPVPFVLSLDLKPFIEFKTNGTAFLAFDPSIGLKFAF
jgi:hypothetical protein